MNGADIDVTLRTHATPAGADFWRVILPSGLIISTGTAQTTGATGLITVPLANVPNDFISSIVNVARDHVTTGQRYYAYNYALNNAPGNAAVQFYVFNWAANAPAPIHTAVYFTVIGY